MGSLQGVRDLEARQRGRWARENVNARLWRVLRLQTVPESDITRLRELLVSTKGVKCQAQRCVSWKQLWQPKGGTGRV